jgi:dihydropteroate synthase
MLLASHGHETLRLDPLGLMGVINATPDSFSDGGSFDAPEAAAAQSLEMARAGAAIIDVGGESTRPGAKAVDAREQIRRVVPVVSAVRQALDRADHGRVWISVDTRLASVAEAALDAGAAMVNDVSAGRDDPAMLPLVAARGAALCLMHMRGDPATMQKSPSYRDVVEEVAAFLVERVAAAEQAGVLRDRVVIDPGIGFGKTLEHNLALLAGIPRFVATGWPVLIGASRKRFIAALDPQHARTPAEREPGTIAVTLHAAAAGAALVRVHDVPANAQALRIANAINHALNRPTTPADPGNPANPGKAPSPK